jgi:thiol-disulfide isomerase/thioredoxin
MLLEFPLRVIALLLAFGLMAACDKQKPEDPQGSAAPAPETAEATPTGTLDRSKAGTPAPAVTFADPDGNPATLADFRGKPLLVNLWATWCAPCIAEMPTLDALAGRDKGLQVLTVSQDMEGREKVDAFFAKGGYANLEAYLDSQMGLMTALKADTLPTTILYDAAGKEVWRMTGMAEWDDAPTAKLIEEAGGA